MGYTVVLVSSALWMLFIGVAMTTENIRSAFLFKFIPLVLAPMLLALAAMEYGVISINF